MSIAESNAPQPTVPPAAGMSEPSLARIPFTIADESKIRSLSRWMGFVGWACLVLVVIDVVSIIYTRQISGLFNAVLRVFIGVWSIQGADAFRRVADSNSADQANLVLGFQRLRSIFLLKSILVLVALALICGVLLLAIMAAAVSK